MQKNQQKRLKALVSTEHNEVERSEWLRVYPKWHHIPYLVHFFFTMVHRALVKSSALYIGNRVPFGTQSYSHIHSSKSDTEGENTGPQRKRTESKKQQQKKWTQEPIEPGSRWIFLSGSSTVKRETKPSPPPLIFQSAAFWMSFLSLPRFSPFFCHPPSSYPICSSPLAPASVSAEQWRNELTNSQWGS